jgi:antitoxin component YwqK of YwqJK toxin-antitoxin module
MGMLDRIKKRQLDGFKEFVQNMEITSFQKRAPIFSAGVLEDPLLMEWVMKNIKTFDDFLGLPSEEIDHVLQSQEQMIQLFAKCMHGPDEEKIADIEAIVPKLMLKIKDELFYLKEVSSQEKAAAKLYILKTTRKLQMEEKIQGFSWKLPPQDVFNPKTYEDGPTQIMFETGVLAAAGEFSKNKRCGAWRHNYETGKIFAEGDYLDGLKIGAWLFYYGNGQLKAEGKYKSDLKHGPWKEWDRSGVLTEIVYIDGVKKES